jgi:hypothetical protein
MGLTTINGLPAHVLLVHFVVVLVPLTALLVVLSVLWPAARRRLGIITPLTALATLVMVPVTTDAGDWLEHHAGRDPLVRIHAHLGDQMLYWSLGVFLLSVAWWVTHDERARTRLRMPARLSNMSAVNRAVATVVAIVAVAVSVGSVVEDYRIGDSGAKAAWHDKAGSATSGPGGK